MNPARLAERGRLGDGAALLAGMLLPLAFSPIDIFPLAWLAPALLFVTWIDTAPRLAVRRGFLFGLGMFGVGVSWVYVAIHDFGYTSAPLAGLLTALFVAVLALYPAGLGYTAARAMVPVRSLSVRLLVLLPAFWVGFEWLRGWFLTGFPWLSLGYSQIDTPLAGFGPVFGVYGLSWACAFIAGALGLLWLQRGAALRYALPGLVVLCVGAALLWEFPWTTPSGGTLKVSLIQGNQPQITKWEEETITTQLRAYADLNATRLGKVDLIVWPENAVTLFYQDLREDYFAELERQARASGTDIILGVPLLDDDGKHYYTTMMSLGGAQGFYKKSHLVPFGEFMPLQGVLRGLIRFFDLPMSSFSSGPLRQPPLQVAGRRAAVSICYEDAFGEEIIRGLPQADFLVNGSNNGWYGNSFAPHQHLQISRMRALETGRPLLRATTNGISALVDPLGRVVAASSQFKTEIVDGAVQPMMGSTLYVRWGNLPVLASLIALAFVLWGHTSRVKASTNSMA